MFMAFGHGAEEANESGVYVKARGVHLPEVIKPKDAEALERCEGALDAVLAERASVIAAVDHVRRGASTLRRYMLKFPAFFNAEKFNENFSAMLQIYSQDPFAFQRESNATFNSLASYFSSFTLIVSETRSHTTECAEEVMQILRAEQGPLNVDSIIGKYPTISNKMERVIRSYAPKNVGSKSSDFLREQGVDSLKLKLQLSSFLEDVFSRLQNAAMFDHRHLHKIEMYLPVLVSNLMCLCDKQRYFMHLFREGDFRNAASAVDLLRSNPLAEAWVEGENPAVLGQRFVDIQKYVDYMIRRVSPSFNGGAIDFWKLIEILKKDVAKVKAVARSRVKLDS